jgi:hypothetical protein
MLVAVTETGSKLVATPTVRGAGPRCPVCGGDLVVRIPVRRVPHFAHRPHAGCPGRHGRRGRRRRVVDVDDQPVLFDLADLTEGS